MVPQIIYLVILALGLVTSGYLHGKPRSDHDVFVDIAGFAIGFGLLWWGGFFSPFGW